MSNNPDNPAMIMVEKRKTSSNPYHHAEISKAATKNFVCPFQIIIFII